MPSSFTLQSGPRQGDASRGELGFEGLPVVVLVRKHHLPGSKGRGRGIQDPEPARANIGLPTGEHEAHRQPGQAAQQMQAHSSQPAGT